MSIESNECNNFAIDTLLQRKSIHSFSKVTSSVGETSLYRTCFDLFSWRKTPAMNPSLFCAVFASAIVLVRKIKLFFLRVRMGCDTDLRERRKKAKQWQTNVRSTELMNVRRSPKTLSRMISTCQWVT